LKINDEGATKAGGARGAKKAKGVKNQEKVTIQRGHKGIIAGGDEN